MQQELQEWMWQERIQPEQQIRNNRSDAAAAGRPDRQAGRQTDRQTDEISAAAAAAAAAAAGEAAAGEAAAMERATWRAG